MFESWENFIMKNLIVNKTLLINLYSRCKYNITNVKKLWKYFFKWENLYGEIKLIWSLQQWYSTGWWYNDSIKSYSIELSLKLEKCRYNKLVQYIKLLKFLTISRSLIYEFPSQLFLVNIETAFQISSHCIMTEE